jgi:5-formyltetrahydrofolate cyclo-ligase
MPQMRHLGSSATKDLRRVTASLRTATMLPASLKPSLRSETLARRDALPDHVRAETAARIAKAALPFSPRQGLTVSGFWPIRSEIDPRLLMLRLAESGCGLALPRVEGGELFFREWRPGDALEDGGFGTSVPPLTAARREPDVMLVPLAAFDRRGGRIGYGMGYYDYAIARVAGRQPLLTVGLAFAAQEIEEAPIESHDRLLDYVLTERGYAVSRKSRATI